MPEVRFVIRWPDGQEESCYSPSTVVTRFLEAGADYPMPEFLTRARIALEKASDRVEAKFGFRCTSAMAQLDRIEARAADFPDPAARVACLSIAP